MTRLEIILLVIAVLAVTLSIVIVFISHRNTKHILEHMDAMLTAAIDGVNAGFILTENAGRK